MKLKIAALSLLVGSMGLLGCNRQSSIDDAEVRTRIHNGHRYLVFKVPGNFGDSFVHDPDCPMEKK